MKQALIRTAICSRFRLTSRDKATRQIAEACEAYLQIAKSLEPEKGRRSVRVPRMVGVDEDMRNWSFYMLLEHNTIVNRSITGITCSLSRGEEPAREGAINPKTDVMPSADPGEEQVEAFRESVEAHLDAVGGLGKLRGTMTKDHPIFGPLDAHGWHCMFGFHLEIHLRQAEKIVAQL